MRIPIIDFVANAVYGYGANQFCGQEIQIRET